jgi:hypothetical protein
MAKNNTSGLELDPQDNLEAIEGIGPGYAKALHKSSVHTFADLAKYDSPADLRQDLIDKASVDVPLWKIENANGKQGSWLHQAGELAKVSEKIQPPTKEKQVPRSGEWEERVSFMVFFDSKIEDKGKQVWRTRTYKTENGDEELFPSVEPTPWVDWIFQQAQLPATLVTVPSEMEADTVTSEADVMPETLDPVSIEIIDVEVDEDPHASILERKLIAKARFKISGPESPNLVKQRSSFLIEMWLIELETMSGHQAAAIDSRFGPNTYAYRREASFEMPPPGRYELYTILLLRPPNEKLVSYAGPTINIVPELEVLEAVTA